MRAVLVSDFADVTGGAAQVAITSARGLAEAGHDVTFVTAMEPISEQLRHPRITVECLRFASVWTQNPVSAARQGIWNGAARAALRKLLTGFSRDETVVHFHQWTKAFSPSVLDVPAEAGFASLISLHDYFFVCPNGAYYRFPEHEPCTLTPMSGACITAACDKAGRLHKAVRLVRQAATSRAAQRAGARLSLISVSSFADQVIGRFLPECHARFVVPSAVALEKGAPVPVADNSEFLFVGRLTEEKGVLQLAETARACGHRLTIAGDGPLRVKLEGFGGGVSCTGWLDAGALEALMRRAVALVFPSTWYETGGLVVLEALARGIPAIVARSTAAADYVFDGANGCVVAAGDRRDLEEAMRILSNPATAGRMGADAYRRYWSAPPSVSAHVEALLAVYRDVLLRLGAAPAQKNRSRTMMTSPG